MGKALCLRRAIKPARDFACALIVFSCLFVALSPVDPAYAPIPVISLLTHWDPSPWAASAPGPGPQTAFVLRHSDHALSGGSTPLISTMLSLVFAAMTTFSLGLVRYLRCLNASSRRGVWREG
jgi:hypothetical protein